MIKLYFMHNNHMDQECRISFFGYISYFWCNVLNVELNKLRIDFDILVKNKMINVMEHLLVWQILQCNPLFFSHRMGTISRLFIG